MLKFVEVDDFNKSKIVKVDDFEMLKIVEINNLLFNALSTTLTFRKLFCDFKNELLRKVRRKIFKKNISENNDSISIE